MSSRKILVLVEGERTDVQLMEHLFHIYGMNERHIIVSYNTNIYVLYHSLFADDDPEYIDIIAHLREHEADPERKLIFNERYSEIILIFDFDPQDPRFSVEKILKMAEFFTESTNMGKLYLNFPMIEAFYHMRSIPDRDYNSYAASISELQSRNYKNRVKSESRNRYYRDFAINKDECNTVIQQNIEKAWLITDLPQLSIHTEPYLPELADILKKQIIKMENENRIAVLCTCVFYIVDFNPSFIQ